MKRLILITLAMFALTYTHAQKGTVSIDQDERISQLLKVYKSTLNNSGYYTIQVGFGTHDKAQRIKEEVNADFPGLSSKIDFDSPTYRVRVGRFKTKLEAERKFNEVRKKYPQAMLLKPKK